VPRVRACVRVRACGWVWCASTALCCYRCTTMGASFSRQRKGIAHRPARPRKGAAGLASLTYIKEFDRHWEGLGAVSRCCWSVCARPPRTPRRSATLTSGARDGPGARRAPGSTRVAAANKGRGGSERDTLRVSDGHAAHARAREATPPAPPRRARARFISPLLVVSLQWRPARPGGVRPGPQIELIVSPPLKRALADLPPRGAASRSHTHHARRG
jgi:hypothetical protein